MKLTTITREGGTVYALIEAPTISISVLIKPDSSVAGSLRETAKELRTKAVRLIRQAELIEDAVKTTCNQ